MNSGRQRKRSANPFNTLPKKVVRESWNTPILKTLHDTYGFKYRYFGLPGVDLLDVKSWLSMIDEIIAFEMPCNKIGANPRENVAQLKANLEELGKPHTVYYGAMEAVVLNRMDFDAKEYKQKKFINLYNLDFCDEITSGINTEHGKDYLRFEFIRRLLQDQNQAFIDDKSCDTFILLITARNQTQSKKIAGLLSPNKLNTQTASYFTSAAAATPIPVGKIPLIGSHGWALKAFIYDTIVDKYFAGMNISTLLFPMLKYQGMPIDKNTPSPMIHWMMVCKFGLQSDIQHSIFPDNFLSKKSVMASDVAIQLSPEPGESESDGTAAIDIFKQYESRFFTGNSRMTT